LSVLRLIPATASTWFKPGATLDGKASWFLDTEVDAIELRLFWFTEVDGSRQVEVVDTVRFDHPGTDSEQPFRFRIPSSPYSFSGSLFTLSWAVEMVVLPSGETDRLDIVVGPRPIEVTAQDLREL